jgi:tripartite-type tricarboxylate transporter receptor subunit TctC
VPDGHTLLLHNLQISANVSLYNNLSFDTEKDLAPVIFINNNPLVLTGAQVARAQHREGACRLRKGKAAQDGASGRRRDRPSLATHAVCPRRTKLNVDHIPYRGAAPALQDIAGGHVDLFFARRSR